MKKLPGQHIKIYFTGLLCYLSIVDPQYGVSFRCVAN